jgi:predicted O-methyltransferase YrrM
MSFGERLKALLRPLLGTTVRKLRLRRAARALTRSAEGVTDLAGLFDRVMAAPEFAPLQHKVEFVALMQAAVERAPRIVVEIGAFRGGTGFLLARVARRDATIVLVDDQFDELRQAALASFAQPGQRVVCLRGNSQTAEMKARVVAAIAGRPVDVLFIDGDHRYEGVSRDFALYSPLVRPGGLIAFHDIVPDRRSAAGADTTGDAGGVPQFWRELKAKHGAAAAEAIRDPEQDACGIGMIYWRP